MGFHRFKRGQLPALLIYEQDETRIKGKTVFTDYCRSEFSLLLEFVVRRQLLHQNESKACLYDGNPKRSTT